MYIISLYCIITQALLWLMTPYPRTISSPYLTGTLVEGRLEEMFSCSGENISLLRLELRRTDIWGEPDKGGRSSRRRRKKKRKESWGSALPSPDHGPGRIPVLTVWAQCSYERGRGEPTCQKDYRITHTSKGLALGESSSPVGYI